MKFYHYHSFIISLFLSIGIFLRYYFRLDISAREYLLPFLILLIVIIYALKANYKYKRIVYFKKFILYSLILLFGVVLPKSVLHNGITIKREFKVEKSGLVNKITTTNGENISVKSKNKLFLKSLYSGTITIDDSCKIGYVTGTLDDFNVIGKSDFSYVDKLKYFYISRRLKEMDDLTKQYFSSLIFGINENVNSSKKVLMRELGISHLFAISGMHIGIVVFLISLLVSKLPFAEYKKLILVFFLLFIYTVLTSMSPSVIRSVVMFGIIASGSFFRYRYQDSINSLFLAFLLLILWNPAYLFSPGFQLSFSATFGILYMMYSFEAFYSKLNMINSLLYISVVASLFTIPFSVYHFGSFSVLAVFTSILLSPIITFYVIVGVLYLIFFSIPIINNYILFVLSKTSLILDTVIKLLADKIPVKLLYIDDGYSTFLFVIPIVVILFTDIKCRIKKRA